MGSYERCPSCGTRMDLPHLKNCQFVWRKPAIQQDRPTEKMLAFAQRLAKQLGYEEQEYAWDAMTYQECSQLIEQLKAEQ